MKENTDMGTASTKCANFVPFVSVNFITACVRKTKPGSIEITPFSILNLNGYMKGIVRVEHIYPFFTFA